MIKKKIFGLYKKYFVDKQIAEIENTIKKSLFIEEAKNYINSLGHNEIYHKNREDKIIVSLTSFGARVPEVFVTITSLFKQTMQPDQIVLWLPKEQYNDDNIPLTLNKLKLNGLQIKYTEDVGPHTKLVPVLKEFPNDIIITVDDDMIYGIDLIEKLYINYKINPNAICCVRGSKIKFDEKRNFLPYHEWVRESTDIKPSMSIMPTGVGGVLYFPGCFYKDVINEELFMALSPTADDLWFKCMSAMNGTKCKIVESTKSSIRGNIRLDHYSIGELAEENIGKKGNDRQWKRLMEHYDLSGKEFVDIE